MKSDAWNPNQYEKFKDQRSQPFYDLIACLKVDMPPRKMVDLGCGTGELTKFAHEKLKSHATIGIDSSKEMLKKAVLQADENLKFEEGDIQNWRAPREYDVIISNAALQWCSDHKSVFTNVRDSLSASGQIAIQMPMNHDYPTHTVAKQMAEETKWQAKLSKEFNFQDFVLSIETYASMIYELGFKEQNVFTKVYPHVLESREGTIEWVKGTTLNRFKQNLSVSDYEAFIDEYRVRLFTQLKDTKPYFYPFKRVFIWARL